MTNTLCGVKPAMDESWIVPAIVLLCFMIIVVIMRCLARATVDMAFWWDDWMNFAALVSDTARPTSRVLVILIAPLTIQ